MDVNQLNNENQYYMRISEFNFKPNYVSVLLRDDLPLRGGQVLAKKKRGHKSANNLNQKER